MLRQWRVTKWAIPEKKTEGVEKMEFPGVLKKWEVDFPRVN